MNQQEVIEYIKMANDSKAIADLIHALHTEDHQILLDMKKHIDFRIKRLEMARKSKDGDTELLKDIEDHHLASIIKSALRGHTKDGNPVVYSPLHAQCYAMEFRYRNLDPTLLDEFFDPKWALDMMEESWIVNTEKRFATARESKTLLTEPVLEKSTPVS